MADAVNQAMVSRPVLLDRIRGCLVGGAVGDALGYPVEFLSAEQIHERFGIDGIWGYWIQDEHGRALFSDDTQMTLFTAAGLLEWGTRPLDSSASPLDSIYRSYLDWLATQGGGVYEGVREGVRVPAPSAPQAAAPKAATLSGTHAPHATWLADVQALHERRAPGNTCLTALESGRMGRIGNSLNSSKGCGGVMRVAPIGLFGASAEHTVEWAAQAAAITHGHPLGYLPAAALAYIVRECAYGPDIRPGANNLVLRRIIDTCAAALPAWFPQQEARAHELAHLLEYACDLARNADSDAINIARLGEGWVGEEALAIAMYCCLRNPRSFDGAIISAVNHGGDSDSTGSIAGNIMGAFLGAKAISGRWTESLELCDLVLEVADSLFEGRLPSQARMARAFAQRAHVGQRDRGGSPYIEHAATVAARVQGGDAVHAIAWLHDVVEDTPATLDDLRRHGFSEEVLQAVEAITRRPGEDYLGFVRRAAANPLARPVKVADVVHNMDLSRLPQVDAQAVARVRQKYLPALEILLGTRVTVKGEVD